MTEDENKEIEDGAEDSSAVLPEGGAEAPPDGGAESAEGADSAEGAEGGEGKDEDAPRRRVLEIQISPGKEPEVVSQDGGGDPAVKKKIEKAITSSLANALNNALLSIEEFMPPQLPLLPLSARPVFPGVFIPVVVNSEEDSAAIERAASAGGYVGFVLTKDEDGAKSGAELFRVGTVAKIVKRINLPDGGINVFVSTLRRFRIRRFVSARPPFVASVEYMDDEEVGSFEVKALTRALVSEMKGISENNPLFSEEMRLNMVNIENPGKIADFVSTILNVERSEQQSVLEEPNVRRRLERVLVFIKRDQDIMRIQKKIQDEMRESFEKNQREHFLRQELKNIQEELGAGEGGGDYQKLRAKVEEFEFEGEVREQVTNELEKFRLMDPSASEYFMARNYLELVVSLPWGTGRRAEPPSEGFDLSRAFRILEKEHYGLDDVKTRILEFLSVRRLRGDNKGSILILVGPPGVGKTSIGRSVAEAMGKPFYRFSVGGMRDEAEIRGHRRTYVGAMPGKILQGLRITKTRSPVFMIDEIDKMGASYTGGDPASALLEVLDPEQNSSFRDTYLDLPFDLSDVFFILTANTLDGVPAPLLDRAEIISLAGYIDQEKVEIARKYLVPKSLEKNGLGKSQVKYTKDALFRIAEEYAREAGVRHYEKCIDRIHRKIVLEGMTGIPPETRRLSGVKVSAPADAESFGSRSFTIRAEDLERFLGKPAFDEGDVKVADVPGTAIGLAWTSMGGDTLLLEAVSFESGKGGLQLTGQMGDVMKESAQIAFNWVRRYAVAHSIRGADWFERNSVHLHIPEGATPKDGPSAGITMATAFMSLVTNRVMKPHVAMTGELDLSGHVMPIGGLREKTVAARRNGIRTIFIPKANERDLEDIPEIVRTGIKFVPVRGAMEVMTRVFQPEVRAPDGGYGF